MISLRYDQTVDALDIRISSESVSRTAQVDPGTLLDLDRMGRPVSIEVIQPARPWPLEAILAEYEFTEEDAAQLRELLPREGTILPFAERLLSAA